MSDPTSSPLSQMVRTTPTRFFNDSCSVQELSYAIERGTTGATSNPVISLNVLKKEMHLWRERIEAVVRANPTANEYAISEQIYRELAVNGAKIMLPVHEREGKKWGRLSIQTDPTLYNNTAALLAQTLEYSRLAPNMQVKMPATRAGLAMVEEATYAGVNLNVTVSFCVPQVMAIGEAIERGLQRRDAEGKDTAHMAPVATMMVGRLDDWLKVVAQREQLGISPEHLEWAGVACFKKAYALYNARGFRTKCLSAAYRNFYHWTEFVGGDVVLTMPHEWQVKYNDSGIAPTPKMHLPVDPAIVQSLSQMADFRRAYDEHGMTHAEFDTFGPTVRTLRSFIEAWHTFIGIIREFMLPNVG